MAPKYLFIILSFVSTFLGAQIPNLDWATYHGGTNEDSFRDMSIDAAGNIYVIGSSVSTSSISTVGSFQAVNAGGSDVFVSKYDTDGIKQWSTYFGGSEGDYGQSIELDGQGNIFITGLTFSSNGIATAGTHQTIINSGGDAFIAKFSNSGTRLWGSYFGGSGFDFSNDIAVDNSGNPIIIGWTNSNNNIGTVGSYQSTYSSQDDVLLAKFNSNGQRIWATYYGDSGFDTGLQVETDAGNNIIISGWSSSTISIASAGAFQSSYGGNTADCFLAKFDQTGSRLWATYYGGNGNDYGDALLVSNTDDIYLSGSTNSPNNIASAGAFQPTRGTGYDAFLTRFSPAGNRVWSTYLGGNDDDAAYRLKQGIDNSIYMLGHTLSTDRMSTLGAFQLSKSGGRDAFLAKYEDTGILDWSTYYGGNSHDFGFGLVLDANDNIFINGNTEGSTNLSTIGSSQPIYGGNPKDGYIAKFEPCTSPVLDFLNSGFACAPVDYVFEFALMGQGPFTIYYNIDGIPQTPWVTDNSNFFPTVNGSLWTKIIEIDSVKSGTCKGTINSVWGFVQVRDSIWATQPVITCDSVSQTYTVTVDLSGGAFGGFMSVGSNGGFINGTTDRFVSFPIPFNEPYFVQMTEAGTFSNCDTITYQGVSGCSVPCPPIIVNLISNSPICAGSPLNLMASGGSTYQWTGPYGFTSSAQNPVINATTIIQSGIYSVTVTGSNNCTAVATTTVAINNPPTIIISTNSPLCAGSTLNLMVSGGSTYQWTGPNGFTSSAQNPVINATTAQNNGIYSVTVTGSNNCTAVEKTTVAINNPPTIIISTNSPLCAGSTLNLMSSGGSTYQWTGPNGFTSSAQNPVINATTAQSNGIYTVTVTANGGCMSTTSATIVINALPIAILSSNSPVCNNGTITFQLSGGISYQWSGPNNFSSTVQNPIITNAANVNSGNYIVTVTGQNGCTTISSSVVNVTGQLNALATSNSPICSGDTLKFTSNNGISYVWNGPNGFNSMAQNPIISASTFNNAGAYLLTASDASGCMGTQQINVVIKDRPIASIIGETQACLGEMINLNSNNTSGSLLWSNNETTQSINISLVTNTTYTLTADLNGCKDTASIIITILPVPLLNIFVNNPVISQSQTIQLIASGAESYEWLATSDLSCLNCPNPIASPQESSTYCVKGITEGCFADTCINIIVKESCLFDFPNIFSPNGDGVNDAWCSHARDCIISQSLRIYNRWGNLLYSDIGAEVCWDGLYDGQILQDQVCTYLLQITKTDDAFESKIGTVTLLR